MPYSAERAIRMWFFCRALTAVLLLQKIPLKEVAISTVTDQRLVPKGSQSMALSELGHTNHSPTAATDVVEE